MKLSTLIAVWILACSVHLPCGREMTVILINASGPMGYLYGKNVFCPPYLTSHIKISFRWIAHLNVKIETIKIVQENLFVTLEKARIS